MSSSIITQTVAGSVTVANNPTVTLAGSTQTVGTVTTVPSGTQTITGTVTSTPTGTFDVTTVDVSSSSGNITAQDSGTSSASGQNSQTLVTGSPTTNSFQVISLTGVSTIGIEISGTWSATLQFERSFDGGTTYVPAVTWVSGVAVAYINSATANGAFHAGVAGCTNFRVRCSAFTSGTATVKFQPGIGASSLTVNLAPSTNTIGVVTTSGTYTTSPTGTQTVAGTGTFTTAGSGTFTTAGSGTFTTAPTGTQTIAGTVTCNAGTGDYQCNIAQVAGNTTVTSTTGGLGIGGDTASGSSDAGNPVKIGGYGTNSEPSAVTTGQRVNGVYTLTGKQIVAPYCNPENIINATVTTTTTTSTTLVSGQGSGVRSYLTSILMGNTSTSNALVTLGDGTSTLYIPVPANGGAVVPLPIPFRSATNTAITITSNTAVTTLFVSCQGFKGA